MSHFVLVSDLHLTDNPLDEYRWGLFPFLREKVRELGLGNKYLFILGDLADHKDYHSARLVNRVVENIVMLYRAGFNGIYILRGNHDGLGNVAFFEFLKWFPYITVITKPEIITCCMKRIAMLPHTKDPENDWKDLDFGSVHYVLAHATVKGARSESGYGIGLHGFELLTSLRIARITGETRVFSGDVHVPQRVGNLEYVGAPYPIRFGDRFRGRVLNLASNGKREVWHYPTIKKAACTIQEVSELGKAWLRKGDQLKVTLALRKEDRHDWKKYREEVQEWCEKKGVILRGIELQGSPTLKLRERTNIVPGILTSEKALHSYVKSTKPEPEVAKRGFSLLQKAQVQRNKAGE